MLNSIKQYIGVIKQSSVRNSMYCIVNYNTISVKLTKLLYRNGLISHYRVYINNNRLSIILYFKFLNSKNIIQEINYFKIPLFITNHNIYNRYGKDSLLVLSTSYGFFTSQELRQIGIGGEVVMEIRC